MYVDVYLASSGTLRSTLLPVRRGGSTRPVSYVFARFAVKPWTFLVSPCRPVGIEQSSFRNTLDARFDSGTGATRLLLLPAWNEALSNVVLDSILQ